MFIDASAMVAMLTDEPEGDSFRALVAAASDPITSAIAVYESALAIAHRKGRDPEQALEALQAFIASARIRVVPVGDEEARTAVIAFTKYGKGRHPAQLNMGDCFAYACAATNGTNLLFKGDDFSKSDIEAAATP